MQNNLSRAQVVQKAVEQANGQLQAKLPIMFQNLTDAVSAQIKRDLEAMLNSVLTQDFMQETPENAQDPQPETSINAPSNE